MKKQGSDNQIKPIRLKNIRVEEVPEFLKNFKIGHVTVEESSKDKNIEKVIEESTANFYNQAPAIAIAIYGDFNIIVTNARFHKEMKKDGCKTNDFQTTLLKDIASDGRLDIIKNIRIKNYNEDLVVLGVLDDSNKFNDNIAIFNEIYTRRCFKICV